MPAEPSSAAVLVGRIHRWRTAGMAAFLAESSDLCQLLLAESADPAIKSWQRSDLSV